MKKLSTYDIELIQFGTSYDDAQAHAFELGEQRSIRFISPFNDSDVIAGQSTVFDEMLAQAPELEHVVVSVGGGGLISGTLLSRDASRPQRHSRDGRAARRERGALSRAARHDA